MTDRNSLKERFMQELDKVIRKVEAGEGPAPGESNGSLNRIEIYEGMIQHCAVAIFAIDTAHRVIHWNRACEELTGLKAEEILGTPRHWMAFYDHMRPCLSDLLVDGREETLQEHYRVFGSSVLLPHGLHAEGWYSSVGGKERYLIFDASPVYDHDGTLVAAVETLQDITELKRVEEERERLNVRLQYAIDRIKTLSGLIPICAGCKKIRDDKGYWNGLEEYLEQHSDASFSHGLCPECFGKYFPDAKKPKA
ncbi:MAG TPA: PAS domain S-box protein [Deltaproteobacteria bacterium]|jgi:PAS domain S-box-containing protein|nr:PAS domain S-box protein [Deltaproteobacteria bacterium]HOI07512.1 PAS domain S-box protein [Deltaproteobacteria bacterium]